jgi:hypothetical protein
VSFPVELVKCECEQRGREAVEVRLAAAERINRDSS